MACHGTYAFIPPPPLPEFYTRKKKDRSTTSTSSSAADVDSEMLIVKETVKTTDGAYDGKPGLPTKSKHIAPPYMGTLRHIDRNDPPPLAIYHICRVCLRPRSPRYHREHPIPINGVPPPPGICRRCRITSIEETRRVADVMELGESNDIKLGFIAPFVPDDAVISNQEMRERNVEKYLSRRSTERRSSQSESRNRRDITYRHVRVIDEPEEQTEQETRTKVQFKSRNEETSRSGWPLPEPPNAPADISKSVHVQPTERAPSVVKVTEDLVAQETVESPKASTSTQKSSSALSISNAVAQVSRESRAGCAESLVRQIARQEIEHYRDAYWKTERSESTIRRIAREEVERYRQAERKLEAHPDPYAHGRMVPVERRIEQERDVPEITPWTKVQESTKVKVSTESRSRSIPQETPRASKSGSTYSSDGANQPAGSRECSSKRGHGKQADEREERPVIQRRDSKVEELVAKAASDGIRNRDEDSWVHDVASGTSKPSKPRTANPINSRPNPDQPRIVNKTGSCEDTLQRRDINDQAPRPRESSRTLDSSKSRTTEYRKTEWIYRPSFQQKPSLAQDDDETEIEAPRTNVREKDQLSTVPSARSEARSWSKSSSKRVRKDSQSNDSEIQAASSRSSKRSATFRGGSTANPRIATLSRITEEPEGAQASRIDTDQWYAQKSKTSQSDVRVDDWNTQEEHRNPLPYPEQDMASDQIPWPPETPLDPPPSRAPSERSRVTRDDDREYLYSLRTVYPADLPQGRRRPFDDLPRPRYVEIEEVVERTRRPAKQSSLTKEELDHDTRQPTPSRSSKGPSTNFERDRSNTERPHRRYDAEKQQHLHDNGDSNHVHFSGNIDVSPTPPDSDASSSEFRSYHSVERKSGGQTDGSQSPEREPDQSRFYTGSLRSGNQDVKAAYDHLKDRVSVAVENGVTRARKGADKARKSASAALKDAITAPKHNDWNDQETIRTRRGQDTIAEGRSRRGESVRRGRTRERTLRGAVESGSLTRALSESPSRQESLATLKQDSYGPYRSEKVTDSMYVEDGSPEERDWGQDERYVYEAERQGDSWVRTYRRRG